MHGVRRLEPDRSKGWLASAGLNPTMVLVGAILGLAALLRLLFLDSDSFWVDEAISVAIARLDWGTFLEFVATFEANMTLYYGLLHLWLNLGDSEFMIRSLSVIPAVATVPVLYALGARLFGTRVGLLGGLLLALNPFHVLHAQEARSYTLLVLLVTVSSFFFARAIEQPSRRNWAGYILTSGLAVYSHLFGSLVLAAHWASLVFLRPRDVPWKGLVWSTLAIGLLLLPLGVFTLNRDLWGLGWYNREPGLLSIVRLFYVLAGGVLTLPVYAVTGLLAFASAARVWRSSWASLSAWRYGFVHAWLIVPIALAFGLSFISPMFVSRFLIGCLPALALLAAIGLSQIRPRMALAAALAVVVVLSALSIRSYYARPGIENWREATRYLLAQAKSGDVVMFYAANNRPAFEYYRDRLKGSPGGPAVVFPPPDRAGLGLWESGLERKPSTAFLNDVASRYERVWLVLSHDRVEGLGRDVVSRSIREFLASRYPAVDDRQLAGVRILLYRKGR